MEIIIAKTAGFCFGVKRAVKLAFNTEVEAHTHTLGPIIHNDTVIKRLEDQGITVIDAQALDEKEAIDTLIIRAHGVSKAIYDKTEEKHIKVVDATCPYVKKIHRIVRDYSQKDYGVIIIGDTKHPEVEGIKGWVEGDSCVIKEASSINFTQLQKEQAYIAVAQTTYKKAVVDDILERLKEQGYEVTYLSTICNATTERQEEAQRISKKVEAMLVIGSPSSSNTQKLYEICKNNCESTWCINDASEINSDDLRDKQVIGITAGASTPEDLICDVTKRLQEIML